MNVGAVVLAPISPKVAKSSSAGGGGERGAWSARCGDLCQIGRWCSGWETDYTEPWLPNFRSRSAERVKG